MRILRYAKYLASNGMVLGESESQTKDPLGVRREEAHFVGLLPIPDLLAREDERARESDRARPAASQCNRTKEDPPKRIRPPPAHIAKVGLLLSRIHTRSFTILATVYTTLTSFRIFNVHAPCSAHSTSAPYVCQDNARKAEQLYKRVCKSIQSSNEIISCRLL